MTDFIQMFRLLLLACTDRTVQVLTQLFSILRNNWIVFAFVFIILFIIIYCSYSSLKTVLSINLFFHFINLLNVFLLLFTKEHCFQESSAALNNVLQRLLEYCSKEAKDNENECRNENKIKNDFQCSGSCACSILSDLIFTIAIDAGERIINMHQK